jgi:integrase/recombinase XerC
LSLTAFQPVSPFFHVAERDLLAELLADKRSANTRRAYEKDLKDFFKNISPQDISPQLVAEFLKLERYTAIALVLQYKAMLIEKGLAEATVNRRLAAIKSLVRYAQTVGRCQWSLEEVSGEKVQSYRDTSGVPPEEFGKLLAGCDRASVAGARDYAILRLLWDNVLRRDEVSKLTLSDFSPELRTLKILGKGRGTQAETVSLSLATTEAIEAWLGVRPQTESPALFLTLDRVTKGRKLSGNAIYDLVVRRSQEAGVKHLSPHRCRHSGITAYLDASNGDIRGAQKLGRHANPATTMRYDDNRKNAQKQATDMLADLI